MYKNDRGFALIGIIIAAAIVLWLAYTVLTAYFKPSSGAVVDEEALKQMTGVAPSEQGIDTGSYAGIVESTSDQLNAVYDQRERDLENLLQ